MERHIVGLGGGGDTPQQTMRLYDHVLALTGKERPRLLYVPTAIGDAADRIAMFYERFARRCEASVLKTVPCAAEGLPGVVVARAAVVVSGGNTANMLAIW